MSKYVKNLIADHLRQKLDGVNDAILVNVVGLNANTNNRLRAELASKNIHLLMVKNSLAARAAVGTRLAAAFDGLAGSAAVVWGAEDVIALAKEVTRIAKDDKFAPFAACGGVMDGERLTPQQVEQVSKWPGRREQLAILSGQILSPGALLSSQLIAAGGALASQIAQRGEGEEDAGQEAAPAEGGGQEPSPAA